MDRKEFLTARRRKKEIHIPVEERHHAPRHITSGLNPYSGPWTQNEVVHLLKRTMFGASKADVDYFKTKTVTQAVDELLNPTAPAPNPPIKEYATSTTANNPDGNIVQGTTWVNDINTDGTVQSQRIGSYKKWWTGVLINQDRSLLEKMVVFWVNHFGNQANTVGYGNFMYKQNVFIRQNALGNFKAMVDGITKDPSMLIYLNGQYSVASAPDENYARELQELFTIGKGPGSQYTETDVKQAARVLTGWQVDYTTFTSKFTASRHATDTKTFSPFYNNTVIIGRTGPTAGQLELTDLLNMIFGTQESAKFLCRKLYRFFVYYNIDDNVETNIISPLADIFRTNNYDIKPVLSALFKSEHFFDVLNQGCYIKAPVDLIIGSLREMNVVFPPASDWNSNYGMWNYFFAVMTNGNQDLHDPPNVSGLPAYYQEPLFHEIWINSDTLPKRSQYTDGMVNSGISFNSKRIIFDLVSYAQTLSNPGNPNDLIDDIMRYMFRVGLSYESKQTIKTQILLSNQLYDYYWTNAWMAYIANPTTANYNTIYIRLKQLFQYLFDLSEYQLA